MAGSSFLKGKRPTSRRLRIYGEGKVSASKSYGKLLGHQGLQDFRQRVKKTIENDFKSKHIFNFL